MSSQRSDRWPANRRIRPGQSHPAVLAGVCSVVTRSYSQYGRNLFGHGSSTPPQEIRINVDQYRYLSGPELEDTTSARQI